MSDYLIEHKIRTLSKLWVGIKKGQLEMKIGGYTFNQWEFNVRDGCKGNAWRVERVISASNGLEAINSFREGLNKIIPKIGFLAHCYMDFIYEPFIVYRLTKNDKKTFFYRNIFDVEARGGCFDKGDVSNYAKLSDFECPDAFVFLQESRNSSRYIPSLLLLFSALESLCDKKSVKKEGKTYETYDSNNMIKILGKGLFDELYGEGGVRHKLSHGKMVDLKKYPLERIYKCIAHYLNEKLSTKITFEDAPRAVHGNKNFVNLFFEPSLQFEIGLVDCEKKYDKKSNKLRGCEIAKIEKLEAY